MDPSAARRLVPWLVPRRWLRALRGLGRPPDPDLVEAGLRGEWLVATIRLLIILALFYIPLSHRFRTPFEEGRRVVLWVAAAALAEALVVYLAVRGRWGRRWIGFFSGVLDVSLVTLSLWIYLRLNRPLEATSDLVIFPLYLLAIGATSLRYDWRICILTGFAACAQYLGMVLYAAWQWELGWPFGVSDLAPDFAWPPQVGRLFLLVLATALAATLVVRAREQHRLSTRDRLTDLANRGFFDESLERIAALAARSEEPVAVAMIDVDHFKRFNDSYGHLAGDAALRTVARLLAGSFRATDLVARYGGEEFAALFPGMRLEDARWRLDGVRRRIAEMEIPIEGRGPAPRLTVSIGVAVWPQEDASLELALARADERLYRAKQAGRDQVVTTSEGDDRGTSGVPDTLAGGGA